MKNYRRTVKMSCVGMNILDTESIVPCIKRMGLDINSMVCGEVR